ncbi:YeeE/YedE family protein [Paracoccus luteus]|uniref:YeeE/YedE family protein n=1 Tax=Paracoccus luteus TaxID=2508543 RepID=UPI00106F2A6F|nr:YeeE/YedE family protein [Paracoccus luteus]
MDLTFLSDRIGDNAASAVIGVAVGIVFGVAAQRSAFCLRAATLELSRGRMGPRFAVWLFSFASAAILVQGARMAGALDPGAARTMAMGSLSGAVAGGLIFGSGMILTRGCPGRLAVLAATGNLRSIVSGLIFAVTAQMTLRGVLVQPNVRIAGLWTTPDGANIDLTTAGALPLWSGLALGLAAMAFALWLAQRSSVPNRILMFGAGVGLSVAAGFYLTFQHAQVAFEPVPVTSITFTSPSASGLMALLAPFPSLGFDVGLIPGVLLGSFLAALVGGELRFQTFESISQTRRAMIGAVMMGFGGVLAGGCSVGNGVSGTAIFAATAWAALLSMWAGGIATDWLVDRRAGGAS